MPPLNSTQKATLNQFMSITSLPEKTATKILKTTGWKLDQALNRRTNYRYTIEPRAMNSKAPNGGSEENIKGDKDGGLVCWGHQEPSKPPINTVTGKGECHTRAYVQHIENISNLALRVALTSFGKLVCFNVNRHEKCAVIEYENAAGLAAAIARPFYINGTKLTITVRRSEPRGDNGVSIYKTTLSHWMEGNTISGLSTPRDPTLAIYSHSRQHFLQSFGTTGLLTKSSFYESSSGLSAQSKERDSLGKLFEKYRASTDEEGIVTIDGMMQYFGDLGVNIETAEVLVPVEIIQAPAMGTMTKDGFIDGWKATGADTVSKQQAFLAGQIKQLSSDMALFKRVYRHTFVFAKEKDQKALPKDTAVVYWDLLFKSPGRPWVTSSTNWIEIWIEFLGTRWNKSVNKDMWNQTFEFFLKTMEDDTLGFWSEDGAWPGVIDDFVAYAKEKRGDVSDTMETD